MINHNIATEELDSLFSNDTPLIDVRAPVEFNLGCLPQAVNLPLLNDEERAQIGIVFKKKGQPEALKLGYELIQGSIKADRIKAWTEHLKKYPEAVIYCFRGGLRSQITQEWLRVVGYDRPILTGGYQRSRNHLMDKTNQIVTDSKLILVSGPTGSGKTELIKSAESRPMAIDLEHLARHRGSAFGARLDPQPSQINFENTLAAELLKNKLKTKKNLILLEDESRLIGRNIIPEILFNKMRESSVVWIEADLSERIDNIYKDYIVNSDFDPNTFFAGFKKSVKLIEKKLGGLRSQEITLLLIKSETEFAVSGSLESNKQWIEKLLVYYYDPLYLGSIERRHAQVAFKGPFKACQEFISKQRT